MPSQAYLEAREKIKAAKAEAQALAKDTFKSEAMALLDELGIDSFSWDQYTPYFNDGDACVFTVYSDYPNVNGQDEYDGDIPGRPETSTYDAEWREKYNAWRETLPHTKVARFLGDWENEDMLFMFGDHATVEVSRSGIEVEEASHD